MLLDFRKEKETDVIWWTTDTNDRGAILFSFDKKQIFNVFRDYPWKLTDEQVRIFDEENPFWAESLRYRKEKK